MNYRFLILAYCLLGIVAGSSFAGIVYAMTAAMTVLRAMVIMAALGSLGAVVGTAAVLSQDYLTETKQRAILACLLYCGALWGIVAVVLKS